MMQRLDAFPHTMVIARRSLDRRHVAVISGGGAGHEPSHAGLVGTGMLSAAVSGQIFASPTTTAVTAAALHCDSSAGTLYIVKNYLGDRLAFGAAAAALAASGRRAELCFVADDAAVDGGRITGRRGLAGTVFVHKIAGALADAGAPLPQVAAAARAAAATVVTVRTRIEVVKVPRARVLPLLLCSPMPPAAADGAVADDLLCTGSAEEHSSGRSSL